MKFIQSPELPVPQGHYSQAVEANGLLFVSGILPKPGASFDEQVSSVFDQLEKVLRAGGCGLSNVVQCTVYLADIGHWPAFNTLYAARFGAHKPARAVVPVSELHFGLMLELQAVAAIDPARDNA